MAISINPVVSKMTLTAGIPQEVYICPANKDFAMVDLTMFKDNLAQDALVAVAVSTNSDPAQLTTVDYFIDDIQLLGTSNSSELSKFVVGPSERLYVQVISGPDVNIRLAGLEHTFPAGKILDAGRLAASSITGTTQTKIYENLLSGVAYISCSATIYNTSASDAVIEVWITSNTTPIASDKITKITIPSNETAILENMTLSPNEKIFVRSSQANTEYFVNGVVTGA